MIKTCNICGYVGEEFYDRYNHCKDCHKKNQREYNKKNKEKAKIYRESVKEKNKEKNLKRHRKYRKENKEEINKRYREKRYPENREKILERGKKRYADKKATSMFFAVLALTNGIKVK